MFPKNLSPIHRMGRLSLVYSDGQWLIVYREPREGFPVETVIDRHVDYCIAFQRYAKAAAKKNSV